MSSTSTSDTTRSRPQDVDNLLSQRPASNPSAIITWVIALVTSWRLSVNNLFVSILERLAHLEQRMTDTNSLLDNLDSNDSNTHAHLAVTEAMVATARASVAAAPSTGRATRGTPAPRFTYEV